MSLPAQLLYVTRGNRLHRHVLARSYERGQVILSPIGTEKWNWWDESGETSEAPRANGSFDVEGHTWGDVSVRHLMNPFSPYDWWIHLSNIYDSLRRKYTTKWRFPKYVDFSPFTVYSFDVLTHDIAQDIAFERAGDPPDSDGDFLERINNPTPAYRKWLDGVIATEKELIASLTWEDCTAYLRAKEFDEIAPGIWVKGSDWPTICVDQTLHKFDMKDGWSDRRLCTFIKAVLSLHLGMDRCTLVVEGYEHG